MERGFRRWSLLSLAFFVGALGGTWEWFDADEFVNLQQAIRANAGQPLYLETPSNHPPFYTEAILRPLVALPGSDLLAARAASLLMTWGAGILLADLWLRAGQPDRARTFLVFWSLNAFVVLTGTRAMNEVPLLFFSTLAVWALARFGASYVAGGAMGLAVVTRLSGVFFLPGILAYNRHRAVRLLAAGGGVVGGLVILYALASPQTIAGFYEDAVLFHLDRSPELLVWRVLKTLWWSGLPVLAFLAWRLPALRRMDTPLRRTGLVAISASPAFLLLPTVHVHYLLPLTPVLVAALTEAFHAAPEFVRRGRVVAASLALLVPASQGAIYIALTPHPFLGHAAEVADWVEANTPTDRPILTDAPQYAILAGRENLGGYYWSLRKGVDPEELVGNLNATSIVVVSERYGSYEEGFPPEFLDALAPLPCRPMDGARIYWTGTAGATPEGFEAGCPA